MQGTKAGGVFWGRKINICTHCLMVGYYHTRLIER